MKKAIKLVIGALIFVEIILIGVLFFVYNKTTITGEIVNNDYLDNLCN
jgi:hypothetical protein